MLACAIIPTMPIETGTHTGQESLRTTLIVLGKNIGEDGWTGDKVRRTEDHLSPPSKISVEATGVAILERLADNAIFTITNTAGSRPLSEEEGRLSGDQEGVGRPLPPEAVLMQRYFVRLFPDLTDRIRVQTNSWDTNTDAKETEKLVKQEIIVNPNDRLVLMTTGFHLPRAWHLFRRVGLRPYVFVSERVLALRNPGKAREFEESELYKKEARKEGIVYAIQRLPFAADLISRITKRSRTK